MSQNDTSSQHISQTDTLFQHISQEIRNHYDIISAENRSKTILYSVKNSQNIEYFIKVLKYPRQKEIDILQMKLPEKCVKLIDIIEIGSSKGLRFRKYPCSLSEFISKHSPVPIKLFKKWSIQIAYTLLELHKINIIHADIKPENILLTEPIENFENPDIVICDFGISCISSLDYSLNGHGTQGYMPNEIKEGQEIPSIPTDVHCLGRVMIKMLGIDPSIFDQNHLYFDGRIISVQDLLSKKLSDLSLDYEDKKNLIELIESCIKKSKADRIGLSSFLEHKFFISDDYRIQIEEEFNKICEDYHKLFVCLKILAGQIFHGSLKKNFILQVIVEDLVKKSITIKLNELKQRLPLICSSNDKLLCSIDEKILQFSSESGSEEFINLELNKENLSIFSAFIEKIQGYDDLDEKEMFSLKSLKMVENILINQYNKS